MSNDPYINKTNVQKNILYYPLVSVKNVSNDILIEFFMCLKFSKGINVWKTSWFTIYHYISLYSVFQKKGYPQIKCLKIIFEIISNLWFLILDKFRYLKIDKKSFSFKGGLYRSFDHLERFLNSFWCKTCFSWASILTFMYFWKDSVTYRIMQPEEWHHKNKTKISEKKKKIQ